jgi:hypothetical protein
MNKGSSNRNFVTSLGVTAVTSSQPARTFFACGIASVGT